MKKKQKRPERGRNVWRYVHSLPNPWEGAKRPGCLRWSTFSHGWPTYTSHGARDYCDDIFSGWLPSYTLTLNFNRLTVDFFPQKFQLLTFHHFLVVVANLKGGINLTTKKTCHLQLQNVHRKKSCTGWYGKYPIIYRRWGSIPRWSMGSLNHHNHA